MATRHKGRLTKEALETILQVVRNGNYVCAAAKVVGVTPQAVYIHKRKHPEFATALAKAEADAEASAVTRIMMSGERDPRYLQWFLSRKYPERWGDSRAELAALRREMAELRKLVGGIVPPEVVPDVQRASDEAATVATEAAGGAGGKPGPEDATKGHQGVCEGEGPQSDR